MRDNSSGFRAGALAFAAFVGGVVGFGLAHLLGPNDAPAPQTQVTLDSPQLLAELQAVRAELVAGRIGTRGDSESVPPNSPAQLTAGATSSDALLVLAESLSKLATSLGGITTGVVAGNQTEPVEEQRNRAIALIGEEPGEVRRRHTLWAEQDLINAYGRPDRIEVQGPIEQWYWDGSPGHSIVFALHSGRVISFSRF